MRFLLSIVLLLSFTIKGNSQNVSISGTISGKATPRVSEIQFIYDGKFRSFKVDKESLTFSGELDLKEAQFVEIKSGGSLSNYVFTLPGETIEFHIEKRTLNETFLEIRNEKIRKLNEPLDLYYQTINDKEIDTKMANWAEELFIRPALAREAISAAQSRIDQNAAFLKENAPQFEQSFRLFSESFLKYIEIDRLNLEQIETSLEELSQLDMKKTVLTVPFFRVYLVDLTNAYAARKLERYTISQNNLKSSHVYKTIAAEAIVKYIPNQDVINNLFAERIHLELAVSGIKNRPYIDFLFAHVGKSVTDRFQERFETLLANITQGENQERLRAKNFEFFDADGKVYTLESFKGKMLYIDFWASWCGPCKMQMPFFKELEELYKGKEIVFAKVSLDTSADAWLKGVESESLKGVVLHARKAFRDPFVSAYGINAIPRFMLIDAEGRVISDNMPKPQEKKEVMSIIDAELNKGDLNNILNKHFQAVGADRLKGDLGLELFAKQSVMTMETEFEVYYNYPKSLRVNISPVFNELFLLSVGESFFNNKYMILHDGKVQGNIRKIDEASRNWTRRIPGLELFLLTNVEGYPVLFAEENSSNSDNQYVLQISRPDKVQKFYIDKEDYLIRKVVETSQSTPRSGGGYYETTTSFNDYKEVSGLMIPYAVNSNNLIIVKVTNAELKPLDEGLFIE
jgi:thiol-disulfide isomerase/thioredoxin